MSAKCERRPLPSTAIPLADGLVYFWPGGHPQHEGYIYFMQTSSLYYENFCADFGPLNLAMTFRFMQRFKVLMKKSEETGDPLVFIAPSDLEERSNAAALISTALLLLTGMTPEEVCGPLDEIEPALIPFRDASYNPCTFDLHVRDVVAGVHQAVLNGFVDLSSFCPDEYEFYERIEHGDFNWMVANKFISMAGPHNERHVDRGYPHFAPEDFVQYFRRHNVTDVVRLNAPMYDRSKFTREGLRHHDMCFTDGSTPPQAILRKFLRVCEDAEGAIAVHCKAGLGRTGTLMGCYIMKHYKLTAREVIAWLRVARPGSVIGPQQHYLERKQQEMWEEGDALGVTRKTAAHLPQWAHDMIVSPRGSALKQKTPAHLPVPPGTPSTAAAAKRLSSTSSGYATTATATTTSSSRTTSLGSVDVMSAEEEDQPQHQQQHQGTRHSVGRSDRNSNSARDTDTATESDDTLSSDNSSEPPSAGREHHQQPGSPRRSLRLKNAKPHTRAPPSCSATPSQPETRKTASHAGRACTRTAASRARKGLCFQETDTDEQHRTKLQAALERRVSDSSEDGGGQLHHKQPKQEDSDNAGDEEHRDSSGSVFAPPPQQQEMEVVDERTHMTQGDELTMRKAQAQAHRNQMQQQEEKLAKQKIAPSPSSMRTPKRRSPTKSKLVGHVQPRRLVASGDSM